MTHVLLGLLSGGERHGYDLKRQYDQRFPASRPLAFGQVYTSLEGLSRRGWIAATGSAKAGAAERTTFAMTADGRAELDRWLGEVEPPAPHAGNPLQVKVTIALLAAGIDVATDYLRAQRSAHLTRMREYARITADPAAPLAEVLAADYALTHLDADLRWLQAAESRVQELAAELAAPTPGPTSDPTDRTDRRPTRQETDR